MKRTEADPPLPTAFEPHVLRDQLDDIDARQDLSFCIFKPVQRETILRKAQTQKCHRFAPAATPKTRVIGNSMSRRSVEVVREAVLPAPIIYTNFAGSSNVNRVYECVNCLNTSPEEPKDQYVGRFE